MKYLIVHEDDENTDNGVLVTPGELALLRMFSNILDKCIVIS